MASSDLDHNQYPEDQHRQSSREETDGHIENHTGSAASDNAQPADDATFYLPATTYTSPVRSPRSKLSISTDVAIQPVNAFHGQLDGSATGDEASPDPHEYYRQLHDPFAAGTFGQPNQHNGQKHALRNNVSRSNSGLSPIQSRGTVAPSAQVKSRTDIRQPYQASPSSQYREGQPTSARSNTSLVSLGRTRQASFQDLVAKFDKGGGPHSAYARAGTDSGSRVVSPATSLGASDGASRKSFGPKATGQSTRLAARRPSQESTGAPRSRANHAGLQGAKSRRGSFGQASTRAASQSMTDLSPASAKPPRRPLFGEVVASPSAADNFSYGIHQPFQRGGSVDSTMHSPNPMFPKSTLNFGNENSATSPDAWYRGFVPGNNIGSEGSLYEDWHLQHRRAQSDVSTAPQKSQTLPFQAQSIAQMTPPLESSDGNPGTGSVRSTQSRIPVRRRHSHASDSAASAPSSRSASQLARTATKQEDLARMTKGPSKSAQKSGSGGMQANSSVRSNTPSKSPARRDKTRAPQPGEKSPLLRANIIAPPPKVSPPLRSSRPRLPVSAASTTSSRAKTIEKLNSLQKQRQEPPPSSTRSRRPPELDNVDLEARRRKITQAFNKTIRENAQKEKFAADRRKKARERAEAEEAARRNDSTRTIRAMDEFEKPRVDRDNASQTQEDDGDVFQTPGEEFSASECALDAPCPTSSDHHVVGFAIQGVGAGEGDDSPTLGRPTEFESRPLSRSHARSEAHDMPPLSAVTAETDGTMFDNEAQTEPAESRSASRTVLSQIMDMRDSSPAFSPVLSENGSEQAEKESIQIMLRNTTYFDDSDQLRQGLGIESENHHTFLNEEKADQWSNSSWTSSIRDRSSPEGPLEPIIERSPDPAVQRADNNSPASSRSKNEAGTHSPPETDAYSYVSRVLEKENPAGAVNRHYLGEIYQKILEQSPDLARQGGWDTQRVTQLCLQEIDRSKYERLSKISSPSRKQEVKEVSAASPGPEHLTPVKPVPGHKYRASLNNAEDFAFTSPSIVDWMQFAAADSPTDESQDVAPPLPPKDSERSPVQREGTLTPRAEHTGDISSAGLNIHLRSPLKSPFSRTPPPRPPSHSPPPLPQMTRSIDETRGAFVQSPSVYENEPPSSIFSQKSFSPQPPQVPRRITSLSKMVSASHSTDALVSGKDSIVTPSDSSLGPRPSLEQPVPDSSSQRASPSPEQKRVIKRKHVIKELVDTEASFGRDMSVVDDIYKGTSSSCLDLSPEDIKTLFGNSAQIVKFSMDFLDSLKQAARSIYVMPKSQRFQSKRNSRAPSASSTVASTGSDDQVSGEIDETTDLEKDYGTFIGEAFKSNIGEMEKVYTIYLKNHDAANRKLQALQQNPNVGIWLNECRLYASDLTNAWDLDSLLVKPVQRLLKYPLFLTQLLDLTPEDHPDREAIRDAMRDLTEVSVRINEMKKHAELVEQGLKRNRKESDVRTGLTKAIGRQTEKLKQNVGVSRVVEDREYAQLRERYSENLARLVLVREDVRTYMSVATSSTKRFNEIALAIDGWIDVGHTGYPEKESRWRQLGQIVRELVSVAIPEHVGAIQKNVVDPMTAAAKMLEALLKDSKGLLQKRDKKSIDYAKWKNTKDRGEKPDKKTSDRMEEWEALNREAKGRMSRLIDLTSHLAQGCLKTFVQIQCTWLMIWQHKLGAVVGAVTPDISKIAREWQEDFDYHEAQALTLGICNGSLFAEAINLLSFTTPASTFDGASSPRPSWNGRGKRSFSINSEGSPKLGNEFTFRHSGSFTASPMAESHDRSQNSLPANRMRAISTASGPSIASDVAVRNGSQTALNTTATQGATTNRPSTSAGSNGPRSPIPPRLSLDAPSPTIGTIKPRTTTTRPDSGSTFYSANGGLAPGSGSGSFTPSPIPRTTTGSSASDFTSSALPLSESPITAAPSSSATTSTDDQQPDVLFLAASVYEFNIDRSRREAGYPYLTYVSGEIFDVIFEKGELWLARNQDDPSKEIGWIWNKHFAKLTET